MLHGAYHITIYIYIDMTKHDKKHRTQFIQATKQEKQNLL